MALVTFYVPDPANGVAEMVRVVAPGESLPLIYGVSSTIDRLPRQSRSSSARWASTPFTRRMPTRRGMEALRDLWAGAGLDKIETREIEVVRTFADFEDFWATTLTMPNIGPPIAKLSPATLHG